MGSTTVAGSPAREYSVFSLVQHGMLVVVTHMLAAFIKQRSVCIGIYWLSSSVIDTPNIGLGSWEYCGATYHLV